MSEVTLTDGTTRELVMTMRAFRALNKRYGNLLKLQAALKDDPVDVTVVGFSLMLGVPEAEAEELMDYERLQEYVDAFGDQLTRGMRGEARAPETAPETTSPTDSSTSDSVSSVSPEPTSKA